MEKRIIEFISALRSSGVRVSLAESGDAFNAVDKLGISEREFFRLSLRATLIKDQQHLEVFDELFPLFFDTNQTPPLSNLTEDLTGEEAQMIAEALNQYNEKLRQMLEQQIRGEPLSQKELEILAQMVGLQNANDLRYRDWMARRMEQALRYEEVRLAMQELLETLAEMGFDNERLEQIKQILEANQQSIKDQIRQYAGQKIAESLSEINREDGVGQLMNRPFNALSEKDMEVLRGEVRRLATVLRSRVALRQKRAKKGMLDPKATIRANLKYNGVPFHIKRRNRRLKPKLVVICDVSTSMRHCSELMLSLIYAMKDKISKTNAFAFIDHLEYISPDFVGKQADQAVNAVLHRLPPGFYSTDLGYSLTGFDREYLNMIDSRTTFIMVGDGRNNYNNPQIEIFRKMAKRSHRMIWINPEPQAAWGTGDSDMWKYAPYCDDILKAGTLKELTAAVDQMLS